LAWRINAYRQGIPVVSGAVTAMEVSVSGFLHDVAARVTMEMEARFFNAKVVSVCLRSASGQS
jgi:hypothetical protein